MRVAILPWGDVIEDFLDAIGVSLDEFCDEMTGGWLFGYVDALRRVGVASDIVCFSARVRRPVEREHRPTGATVVLLPASVGFRLARGHRPLAVVAAYLATPPWRTLRHVRQGGYAALLVQEYEYPRFDVCVAVGAAARVPVVGAFQGGDFRTHRVEGLVRPWTVRAARGLVIGPSAEVERVRSRYGVAVRKLHQVPNPFDLADWRPPSRDAARAALGITDDEFAVGWHGRVEMWRKGLDVLVETWRSVRAQERERPLRLLLRGGGVDAERLRRLLDDPELGEVTWFDEYTVDRESVRSFLATLDLYVLPSRHEGFPVAPLEAMACGVPVVAADAQGVADIFAGGESSGGIVVPRADVDATAAAVLRLVRDVELARELGRRARLRVESEFAPARVGELLRAALGI